MESSRPVDQSLTVSVVSELPEICHGSAAGSQSGPLGSDSSVTKPSLAPPEVDLAIPPAKRTKESSHAEVIPQDVMNDVEASFEVSRSTSNDSNMGASTRVAGGLPPALPGRVAPDEYLSACSSRASSVGFQSIPPIEDRHRASQPVGGTRPLSKELASLRSRGKARSTSAHSRGASTGTRNLKMKRGGIYPNQRTPLEEHTLVPECRAGPEQDVEARFRVLFEQRDQDHLSWSRLKDYIIHMEERHAYQIQELDHTIREMSTSGMKF